MSALPKAVQKQIDAANKIASEVYGGKEDTSENSAEVVDISDERKEEPKQEQKEEPKQEQKEEPKQEQKEEPKQEQKEDNFDHKYKVLQGKYNAEVPRLQSQLKEAQGTNEELRQRMLNLEAMLAAMNTKKDGPEEKPKEEFSLDITDEERDMFGDDLIDLVTRIAKRSTLPEIDSRIGSLKQNLEKVEKESTQVRSTLADSKRRDLLSELAAAVPNWEQQNEDPAFLQWLDAEDVYTGAQRGQLLTQAFKANDARRVIAFFKGFQSEHATESPSDAPKPKQEPRQKLDDFVAPGTPKTGTVSTPNESGKRVWTQNDVRSFYAKRNEFIKQGKPIPENLAKLEKDLFKAQQEGRLR